MARRTFAALAGLLLVAALLAPLEHQHWNGAGDAFAAGAECPACVGPLSQGELLVETDARLPEPAPEALSPLPREAVDASSAGTLAARPVRGPPSIA